MNETTHLVIGQGEVGTAIYHLLSKHYTTEAIDKDTATVGEFDFIHICYPYSDKFRMQTMHYQLKYLKANGTCIIHSTVPVGTTDRLAASVHSPIRGVHPNLAEGIQTFPKFFGGKDVHRVNKAMEVFEPICPTQRLSSARATEALKLWCTTQYGWNIILQKAIHQYCEANNVPFDEVYTLSNTTYNEGYQKLGMGHVMRPVLKHHEGKIGGHCVIPNCEHLESDISSVILIANDGL
jgi:hypothetical protein